MPKLIKLEGATREPEKPIIQPRAGGKFWWEKNGTFNPGVTQYKDSIILAYRAYDTSYVSRLGIANSRDGINFTQYDHPAIDTDPSDPYERIGIEDPRITKIGATYYIVHTAASYLRIDENLHKNGIGEDTPWRVRVAMHTTDDFKTYNHHGVILPDASAKNAALFPEKINNSFCLIYREWIGQDSIIQISFTDNFQNWKNTKELHLPAKENPWMEFKWGIGSQPILTDKGFLIIYHGVDNERTYRLGLLMLDRKDPSQILWYTTPILEPIMPYEKVGYVPNVVYSCGAILRDKILWIYYGAADYVVGRAVMDVSKLI